MADLARSSTPLLRLVIIGAYLCGIGLAVTGVWLVYLGAVGETEFTFFGQTLSSTSVGIPAIFIGGAMIVLLIRRTLKSIDAVTATGSYPPTKTVEQHDVASNEPSSTWIAPKSFSEELLLRNAYSLGLHLQAAGMAMEQGEHEGAQHEWSSCSMCIRFFGLSPEDLVDDIMVLRRLEDWSPVHNTIRDHIRVYYGKLSYAAFRLGGWVLLSVGVHHNAPEKLEKVIDNIREEGKPFGISEVALDRLRLKLKESPVAAITFMEDLVSSYKSQASEAQQPDAVDGYSAGAS